MKMLLAVFWTIPMLFVVVGSANSASINIINAERKIEAIAEAADDDTGYVIDEVMMSSVALGVWDESAIARADGRYTWNGDVYETFGNGSATQVSNINIDDGLVVDSESLVNWSAIFGNGYGWTTLEIEFTVDSRQSYTIDLYGWAKYFQSNYLDISLMQMGEGGGQIFSFEEEGYVTSGIYEGFLDPGSYLYSIYSDKNDNPYGHHVVLAVSEVPIPGAILLLGSGLFGILCFRKKV